MSNYFRDFMRPTKIIFDRLIQQKNQSVIINGNDGNNSSADVEEPYYPDLPEYPVNLIRDANNKVTELHYGLNNSVKGYIWSQTIVRDNNGKVTKIVQNNPDGTFDIVFTRDSNNRVTTVSID